MRSRITAREFLPISSVSSVIPSFTTKPIGKGTGLGLSISYQIIVERHGGSLQIESVPGSGANFLIWLPLTLDQLGDKLAEPATAI